MKDLSKTMDLNDLIGKQEGNKPKGKFPFFPARFSFRQTVGSFFFRLLYCMIFFCQFVPFGMARNSYPAQPIQNDDLQLSRVEYSSDPIRYDESKFKYFESRIPFFSYSPDGLIGIICLIFLISCGFFFYHLYNKRKERRMKIIFKHLPFRYFIVSHQGRIISHNVGQLFNLLSGRFSTLESVANEGVRRIMKEKTQSVIQTGISEVVIYAFEESESRSALISRLPDSVFGFPAVIWISQDISELQMVRNEIKKKEEFYRLTLESTGDAVITTDENGLCSMLNPVAESMLGIKNIEAIGRSLDQLIQVVRSSDHSSHELPVRRALETGEAADQDDLMLLSNDKKLHYYITYRLTPIHGFQGKIIGVLLMIRDVSEEYRRQRETELELANRKVVSDMARIYDFRLDLDTFKVETSHYVSNLWPITDGIALPPENWVLHEDLMYWKKNFNDIRTGRKSQVTFQYRVLQEESIRYFRIFLRSDQKQKNEITGLLQELTDLIREQKKQNAMQELWTTCINAFPAMIFIKSVKDQYSYLQCNDRFAEYLGRSSEDLFGYNDNDLFEDSEEMRQIRQNDQKVIESGVVQEFNESVICACGELHQFRVIKVPVRGIDGNPLLFGIAVDVTEDYQLRKELQALNRNWEIASEIAKIVTYRINYKTWEITGDKLLSEFWLIRDGKAAEAKEWVYPEDVPLCEDNYDAVICDRVPHSVIVYRVSKEDGMHYYRLFMHKMPGSTDEITGLIQDITPYVTAQMQKEAVLTMWEKIINSIPAMIYIKDAENDFRYLLCNYKISQFFDRPAEEIIGHTDEELFNQDEDTLFRSNDQSVMELGKSQTFYENLKDTQGILRRFETTKIPAKNANGRPVLIGMTQEISKFYELSEINKIISSSFEQLFSIEDQKEGISTILKNICEYIGFSRAYITCIDEENDSLQLYTYHVSDNERSLFDSIDFASDESKLLPWFPCIYKAHAGDVFQFDFTKEEDRIRARHHIPRLWKKCEEYDIQGIRISYIFVDDKPWGSIGFIMQHEPIRILSKNEIRLLDTIIHIIELAASREQTYMRLKSALLEVQAADKAKSFFLASMSHEIRTPLNAVIGFADLLINTKLNSTTFQDYITNISLAGHSLLQLINDILDLSKLEAGQVVFVPERTNMTEFCEEIVAIFSHTTNQKNLRLVFETTMIPIVYVDQQRLRQIFFNLVGNAIKFTNVGSITIGMDFEKTSKDEGTLTVIVADTGIGIPPEDCERLFEPFVQLTRLRGTSAANNGTGLGLPIVKKMIAQMGGSISLTSTPGKGTQFKFTIPHLKTEIMTTDPPRLQTATSRLCPPDEEPHILLVDDVPMNLKVLSSMLSRMHIDHETASSGKDALADLEKGNFNIVMTDLIMPEMNGEELAKTIRSNPKYASIRIAVVTAEQNKSVYDFTLFDQIMIKPISRDELYEYIYGK